MTPRLGRLLAMAIVITGFIASLHAQVPSTHVFAHVDILPGQELQASCGTNMDGDTAADYVDGFTNCRLFLAGNLVDQFECTPANPDTACFFNEATIPGAQYQVSGVHGLFQFSFAACNGDFDDFLDYEVFGSLPQVGPDADIFSKGNGDFCNAVNPIGIAVSFSDAVTTQDINPTSVTVMAGDTPSFTTNKLGNWSLSGPGTISTALTTTTYFAPSTIDSQQSATLTVCDTSNPSDCANAFIDLVPITVTVQPSLATLNGDQAAAFSASVSDRNKPGVTWSISPPGIGTLAPNGNNATYTAPSATSFTVPQTLTVTAISTADNTRIGSATISLLPVTVVIIPPGPFLAAAGATTTLTANVNGLVGASKLAWAITSGPGTIASDTGIYTAPSPAIASAQNVSIQACVNTITPPPASRVCDSTTLVLSPAPIITTVNPAAWPSGQATLITITGTGFGTTAPNVTISDPTIVFSQTSYTFTAQSQTIQGTVSPNPMAAAEFIALTVTTNANPINSTSPPSGTITVNPVTITVSFFPTSATLLETQQQSFAATVGCKTAGNLSCTVSPQVTCSLSQNLGTVTAGATTSCVYTATATVTGQQPQQLQLIGKSVFNNNASGTASITLTPLNVTVTPGTAVVNGGQTQKFTANVTGALNNNNGVTWTVTPPVGVIDASGTYTAPNPIAAGQNLTVKACSVLDTNVCGTAQVNLQPITVVVAPSAVSLSPSASQQFTSTVTGTNNTGVTWSISPSGLGTITTCGLYTAPPPPNVNQQTVTVKACTVVTPAPPPPNGCGTATVTLLPSPDFSVTVTPPQQTVNLGGTANYTVTVNPLNGFTGTVSFASCTVSPATSTITVSGCPTSVSITSGSASFQIGVITTASTPPQGYTVTASGAGTGFTHAGSAALNVVSVTLLPATLTFAAQNTGTSSSPQTATLTNIGLGALNISSITTSGDFSQSNNCPASLGSGGSCSIQVTFTPTATGTRAGTLTVNDNAFGGPQTTGLSGTGTAPVASFSPASLTFPGQIAGTTSAPKPVTLTNTGTGAMSVGTIAANNDFSATNNCPPTLAPNGSCTINVTYTPSAVGPGSGTLSASDNAAGSPQSVPLSGTGTPGLRFVPVTGCRVVDTRNPNGPFGGPFLTGGAPARQFVVPNSACNIPATAQAYSLNVTVVPHSAPLGFLTMFPCGQTQPGTSTLNSIDGRVKGVAAIVPAGTSGAVCAFANNDTDLILDINGYFTLATTNPAALTFYPVTPCRLVDTRNAAGPLGGPSLAANTPRTFPIQSGSCSLPANAQAYSLNFTAVPPGALGFLTVWPAGQTQPGISTLNAPAGTQPIVTANAAIVPAGTSGGISVFASNNTDLVIDVNGYFAAPGTGGLSLFTLPPCRALDTRNPAGSPPFNGTISTNIAASGCGAPATASEYVLNATVVPPGPLGFLTLWAAGASQPLVSTLNAVDGAVTSNMAIVPANNGSVNAFGSNPTHLILDVLGYFSQ